MKLYSDLLNEFGPQGWWPTKSKGYHPSNLSRDLSEDDMLEICVGAILTQNTNWSNVERALASLFDANAMSLEKIANMKRENLAKLIRSSGFYNQKSERLQLFARHVLRKYGSFSEMFKQQASVLREELLSLKGIGRETADSMLLYAGRKSVFVVDTYTRRLCEHHKLCDSKQDYDVIRSFFEDKLPNDHKVFNEMHALIVAWAKRLK